MLKLVLDPGHGGIDAGAVGNGIKEKDLNLELCRRIAGKLEGYDVEVTLTRTADVDVDVYRRCELANSLKADYFCSVHANSGGGTGFESYVYTHAGEITESLRGVVHEKVAAYFKSAGFPDRGKKRANFVVLRETGMPAVLLENLFLDSPRDAVRLKDTSFLDGLAAAVAGGLVAALGIPVKEQAPPPLPWDPAAEIARLKADGLINSDHRPEDPVTWGELATVINRLRGAAGS